MMEGPETDPQPEVPPPSTAQVGVSGPPAPFTGIPSNHGFGSAPAGSTADDLPTAPVDPATLAPPWGQELAAVPPPPSAELVPPVPVWGAPAVDAEPATPVPAHRTGGVWRWVAVAVVAAIIGAAVGGGIVAAVGRSGSTTDVKEISAGPALLNGTTNIESVIAKVLPAVVSIDATGPAPTSQSIFGGTTGGGTEEDQGTGVIVSPTGEVVTNNHVIAGATTITVTLYGQTKAMAATLVDTDPTNDIALVQITGASNLPTVSYGNSDNVQVGDAVVAIGNALGLSAGTPTVTQGIISAEGRTVQAGDESSSATETLTNMFQTDAAINPGNSGGPLVDSSGKVIAMNTAVASSSNGSSQAQNIGFAIPSDRILGELDGLRHDKIGTGAQQGNGYLGISIETLTAQLRSAYDFVPTEGAIVTQVDAGSPADQAGLEEGDVITTLNGKPVTSADQLASAIQAEHPGQQVTIGCYRGQTLLSVKATLGSETQAGT